MKWKTVKKRNKWVKRPDLETEDWLTLIVLVLAIDCALLRVILRGV